MEYTKEIKKFLDHCTKGNVKEVKAYLETPFTQEALEEGFSYAACDGRNEVLNELIDWIDIDKIVLRSATNACLNNKIGTFDHLMSFPLLSEEKRKEIPYVILEKAIYNYGKITFGKHILLNYSVHPTKEFIAHLEEEEDYHELAHLALHQQLKNNLPQQVIENNKAKI